MAVAGADLRDRSSGAACGKRRMPGRKRRMPGRRLGPAALALLLLLAAPIWGAPALAQGSTGSKTPPVPAGQDTGQAPNVPQQVDVQPAARDEEIAKRLTGILRSTGWFQGESVSVQNGVVFLEGRTTDEQYKAWAGNLAAKTQDVAAVVNRIQVIQRSPWDLTPAVDQARALLRSSIRALPQIGLGLLLLALSWFAAGWVARFARPLLAHSMQSPLLRDVAARALAFPVFFLGLYFVLQILGLTRLALTVLGGTGLAGLIVGIAFRNVVENFLASIMISTHHPFRTGDLVEIGQHTGIVERVTTRGTVLIGLDGNYIQIPNATVYVSEITNYSANPKRRLDFAVGIGYDDGIPAAQELLLQVLLDHPAVLKEPEPLVLVEKLGASSVDLRVFFWIDSSRHDFLKVKSSAIRLTKRALQAGGFTLPDSAREVIFPQGVPLAPAPAVDGTRSGAGGKPVPGGGAEKRGTRQPARESASVATAAEGGLGRADEEIRGQAVQAWTPEADVNLLEEGGDDRGSR